MENKNFGKSQDLGQKSKFWLKNQNFGQKSRFWSKITILVKNQNFGKKSCWSKIKFLEKIETVNSKIIKQNIY